MGNAGPAIIFMLLFVASMVVGLFVLAFVARCVLVVVQETGLGQDEVTWPSEPIQDWLVHCRAVHRIAGFVAGASRSGRADAATRLAARRGHPAQFCS